MSASNNSVFSRTTTLISIGLAILGLIGLYIAPSNINFIILGISATIFVVLIYTKINQLDENTEQIHDLYQKFDVEGRFHSLERELAEQKGKISILGGKK